MRKNARDKRKRKTMKTMVRSVHLKDRGYVWKMRKMTLKLIVWMRRMAIGDEIKYITGKKNKVMFLTHDNVQCKC